MTLDKTATVGELRREIAERSSEPAFDLKRGYPPQPLYLDVYDDTVTLADAGLDLNGEQIIVAKRAIRDRSQEPLPDSKPTPNTTTHHPPISAFEARKDNLNASASEISGRQKPASEEETPEVPIPSRDATMMLRVMPSDNSCLFRAFSYLMFGPAIDSMRELRSLVASTIQNNPDRYSDAVLDQPRDKYCEWIQDEHSWGGYVELTILSQHFEIGIASINVQDGRVDFYNEEVEKRSILVYSGIHYDAVAVSPNDRLGFGRKTSPDEDIKTFDRHDDIALAAALELCGVLRSQNYHVDVSTQGTTKLKCLQCDWTGNGMDEVSFHVSTTGHTRLSQA